MSLERYDGTSFITSSSKRWDGTSWVDCSVKRWDGTSWVTAYSPIQLIDSTISFTYERNFPEDDVVVNILYPQGNPAGTSYTVKDITNNIILASNYTPSGSASNYSKVYRPTHVDRSSTFTVEVRAEWQGNTNENFRQHIGDGGSGGSSSAM